MENNEGTNINYKCNASNMFARYTKWKSFCNVVPGLLLVLCSLSSWGLHMAGKSWTVSCANFHNVLYQFGNFIAPVLCWTKESTLLNLSFFLLMADDQDLELATALGINQRETWNYIAKGLLVCVSCKCVAHITFVIYICSFVVLLSKYF